MADGFSFDGYDSKISLGIYLQKPVEFSPLVPIREKIQVAGRNGTVYLESGNYENRIAKAECFFAQNHNLMLRFQKLYEELFKKLTYSKLTTTDDPDHYWMAKILNGGEINVRAKKFAPFTLEFDCKPQRYLVDVEDVVITENGKSFLNPTDYNSNPVITIQGIGEADLTIGDVSFRINKFSNTDGIEGTIIIDCEDGTIVYVDANGDSGNGNPFVYIPTLPYLKTFYNKVSWNGNITQIIIEPRWWEL